MHAETHGLLMRRMNARANPELMARRRCTAEHPFGTIKRMMAGGRFLTRNLKGTRAEMALSVLAYNYPIFGADNPTAPAFFRYWSNSGQVRAWALPRYVAEWPICDVGLLLPFGAPSQLLTLTGAWPGHPISRP